MRFGTQMSQNDLYTILMYVMVVCMHLFGETLNAAVRLFHATV